MMKIIWGLEVNNWVNNLNVLKTQFPIQYVLHIFPYSHYARRKPENPIHVLNEMTTD